jgi:hypothetical protein
LKIELTSDELILAIVAVVRAVNPKMLIADGEGFTLDFTPLVGKESLTRDEQLLVKLRSAAEAESGSLEFNEEEALRITSTLDRLESLQAWPADVLTMSRAIRARLTPSA